LMCVTLGIATWIGVESVGGFDSMIARLPPSYLEPMGTYPISIILVFSLTAVSALIEPGFYQRIFAAKSYKTVVWALVIGLGLWSAFDWATTTLGMVAQVSNFEITEPKYALLEITLHLLPVGLSGLFVAGVLATAMSTIDSYLLIAGGNISYDIMRPLAKEPPSDARLLYTTRVATAAATLLAVTLALFFQSIVSAWVFMATLLISSALVPVMAGLYTSGPHSPKAGFLSSLFGLAVALLFYILVHSFGVHDPAWETTVIKLSVFGSELELWQEHALLFSLPAAIGGYFTGAFWDRLDA
ncbi:hypothetical protein KAI87_10680, partial [Myxococcota bacterium]|nr:hypothetical protein [Myxococcota bacterium]